MLASTILRNATVGLAMVLAATLATTSAADAHHWHHHHNNWGWAGAAFVGGLAVGALATPYYRRHYANCGWERHVFWRHGHRVVRSVRVCYS